DAGQDVLVRFDARPGSDAREATADDVIPPIDVRPRVDVRRDDCPDADATLVYLVSAEETLLSFYPPTATFTTIGTLACPAPTGMNPFSMAVDRKGKAYVLYWFGAVAGSPGRIFQVSTATAACVSTSFVPGQQGFDTFGMGFVSDNGGPAE